LSAFVGRYKELEKVMDDNIWQVVSGQVPQSAGEMPHLTNNVDWVLRLTEKAGTGLNLI